MNKPLKRSEIIARKKIVEYLKYNGWYGVMHTTHYPTPSFVIYELNKDRTPDRPSDIYDAVMESVLDLDGSIDNRPDAIITVFRRVKSFVEVWFKMRKLFKSLDQLKKINYGHCIIIYKYDNNHRSVIGSCTYFHEVVKYLNKYERCIRFQLRPYQLKGFKRLNRTEIVAVQCKF